MTPLGSLSDFTPTDKTGEGRCRLLMGKIAVENRTGWFYGMCELEGTVIARTGMLVVVTAVTGGCLCGTTTR